MNADGLEPTGRVMNGPKLREALTAKLETWEGEFGPTSADLAAILGQDVDLVHHHLGLMRLRGRVSRGGACWYLNEPGSSLRYPLIIDRDDLDLSELRAHCRGMHRGPMPRSNVDLSAWHSMRHHRYASGTGHTHRGPFVLVQRPSDHGRRPVGQLVWPLGHYTGQEPVTREQLNADFRARIAERRQEKLT